MKNLKKVLAVVLVVALAFSLMAVAGAKQVTDFSDASSIKYTEAVDFLTGLGIIQGSGGTTFDPKGTFTREQAAKIVAYVSLGTAVADKLTTTTSRFSDVEPTRWSAPFIEYCAANGIINGFGDGTFNPTAPVTGTGMAKLLLTAIGYGAKGEYTGISWELNALVKAQSLGILTTDVNYSAPATREEVAQYTFNALTNGKCNVVTYNVVTGKYETAVTYDATDIASQNSTRDTLGARVFGLSKVSDAQSYYGLTAHHWTAYASRTVVSGVYSDDNVIYTSTAGGLWTIANMTSTAQPAFYKASDDTAVTPAYYVNGNRYFISATANPSALTDITGLTNDGAAANAHAFTKAAADLYAATPGVITKLLDNNHNGAVDAVYIISKSVTYLTGMPSVAANGSVTWYAASGMNSSYVKGTLVYPADLATYDYITYVTVGGVTYVEKATKVNGQITAANNSQGTVTFGGNVYKKAGYYNTSFLSTADGTYFNIPAVAYIDSNGYMIVLATDSSVMYNYGLLVGYAFSPDGLGGGSASARLYTNDGKVAVYSVAPNAAGVVPNQGSTVGGVTGTGEFATGNAWLVKYAVNSDGKVTLTPAGTADTLSSKYSPYGTTVSLTSAATTYYVTSSTEIIYFNSGNPWSSTNGASITTGYASAGTEAASGSGVIVIPALNQKNAAVVYFMTAPAATNSGNFAYFLDDSYTLRVVNGTAYYDYTAYVNGEAKTLTSVGGPMNGLSDAGFYNYTLNAGGFVTAATSSHSDVSVLSGYVGETVTGVDAGYIAYGTSSSLLTTANTAYYKVTPAGVTATTSIPASITNGATTTLLAYRVSTTTPATAVEVYYSVS